MFITRIFRGKEGGTRTGNIIRTVFPTIGTIQRLFGRDDIDRNGYRPNWM